MSEYMVQCMPVTYKETLLNRIKAHSVPKECTGCRIWQKSVSSSGYPQIKVTVHSWGGKPQSVHRLVYFLSGGEITPGDQISHLCHNRLCVEVTHLSSEPPAINSQRNNCKTENNCAGHEPYANCLLLKGYIYLDYFRFFTNFIEFIML